MQTGQLASPDRAAAGLDWVHAGVSWDEGGLYTSMADFDLDGRLDILVGASDYDEQWGMIFHQQADGTFVEIAQAAGFVHPCPSSPVVADFDRDGDLDIVAGGSLWRTFCNEAWGGDASTAGTPEIRLYENDAAMKGAYFAVRLVGDGITTNTTAIGARVVVEAGGVRQLRELGAGHGHFSMQDDTVLFFGVGDCVMAASVEVTWPDAARTMQRFENVPLGRLVEIHQGSDEIVEPP
jgi:enediyne biosynthesis protein E4